MACPSIQDVCDTTNLNSQASTRNIFILIFKKICDIATALTGSTIPPTDITTIDIEKFLWCDDNDTYWYHQQSLDSNGVITWEWIDVNTGNAGSPTLPIIPISQKAQEEKVFEKCKPCIIELKDGACKTLADILAVFGGQGIAGFDFDLKPIDGHGQGGFIATTSDAWSNGPMGYRNLDASGSWEVPTDLLPDCTYCRLDLNQEFCAAPGSVAILSLSVII